MMDVGALQAHVVEYLREPRVRDGGDQTTLEYATMRALEMAALLAWLLILPVLLAAVSYALMWSVLLLFRYVPVIGRKHRHAAWGRMNREEPTLPPH
jgi:hypothetical protein